MKLSALVLALACTLFAQASAPPVPIIDSEQCVVHAATDAHTTTTITASADQVITLHAMPSMAMEVGTDQVMQQEHTLVDNGMELRSELPAANYAAASCCGDGGGWSSPWTSQRFAHPLVAAFASLLLALAFWRSHVRSRLHASL